MCKADSIRQTADFKRIIDVEIQDPLNEGIAHSREKDKSHGRLRTASLKNDEIKKLSNNKMNNYEIARNLK